MSVETAVIDGRGVHRVNNTFVTDWRGLGGPGPRRVAAPAPRRHGLIESTSLYGPRVMPVLGWCGDTEDSGSAAVAAALTAFDALKGVLLATASHLVVIRRRGRGADEQLVCRIAGDISDDVRGGGEVIEWGFELVASDPRLYGTTLNSQARTNTGNIAVNHAGGNTDTPAFIEVHGPTSAGTLTLTNTTTGAAVVLASVNALGGSESLHIDTQGRTVFEDGDDLFHPEYVDASATDWWELIPGGNTIAVAGTAIQAGTTTTVRWRDARI